MTDPGKAVLFAFANSVAVLKLKRFAMLEKFSSFAIIKHKAIFGGDASRDMCTKAIAPIRADLECQFSWQSYTTADIDSGVS